MRALFVESFYLVPHRQNVFSVPMILRLNFKYNHKLLTKLCHCVSCFRN